MYVWLDYRSRFTASIGIISTMIPLTARPLARLKIGKKHPIQAVSRPLASIIFAKHFGADLLILVMLACRL